MTGKTGTFEKQRPRLLALAYRMLGSRADAEDIVQEAFIRWDSVDHAEITDPPAWLTTVCTRLAIDRLRAAYQERKHYVGPWLPDPVLTSHRRGRPDAEVELSDSLSLAFLLILERLSPLERAAFLLHDVFDYPYDTLSGILDRSQAACRQLVSRARRRIRDRPRYDHDPEFAETLLHRFLAAARDGDLATLESMLAADAEVSTDSGGRVPAARNIITGSDRIARFVAGIAARETDLVAIPASVNGAPGAILCRAGRVVGTVALEPDQTGRLSHIFLTLNPDKVPGYGAEPDLGNQG